MKKIGGFLILFILVTCGSNDNENGSFTNENTSVGDEDPVFNFMRISEPKENAFSILIPKGWKYDGGIFRVNPIEKGPSNAIAAKLDFTIKKDSEGSVMIRWLPDVLYFDARYSPAGQMGMFPQGSNYQGMTVWNFLSPFEFILQFVIPYAHPNAANISILNKKNLPDIARNYTQ